MKPGYYNSGGVGNPKITLSGRPNAPRTLLVQGKEDALAQTMPPVHKVGGGGGGSETYTPWGANNPCA